MALLLVVTINGADELWPFVALAVVTGSLGALGNPAGRSLVPEIVPVEMLTGALALRSIAGQTATIAGPAIGGLLFAIKPESVYVLGVRADARVVGAAREITAPPTHGGVAALASQAACSPGSASSAGRRPPRRDLARPLRRAVRRRRRPAAALRAVDPARRPVRPRHAAQRGRGRCADRCDPSRTQADEEPRRPHPVAHRRRLRREHDRLRALPLVPALAARARRQRLRRHVLDEHPLDDGRPRDARPTCAGA